MRRLILVIALLAIASRARANTRAGENVVSPRNRRRLRLTGGASLGGAQASVTQPASTPATDLSTAEFDRAGRR